MHKTSIRLLILAAALLGLCPISAFAATFYASPTGSGSTCSTTAPCTVAGGIARMVPGDTLILKNGIYTGAANMMSEYASTMSLPPSGTAGSYTTVKAENVGQAIIDAQYQYPAFSNRNTDSRARNYLHIDGIHFRRGSGGLFYLMGAYNWISNCGFEDGMSGSDTSEVPTAAIVSSAAIASKYNLVEDCWVWGRGRYGFYFSGGGSSGAGTNHNILRRVVVRQDSVPPWQSAGFRFYKGQYNVCQNCIVIDSKQDGATGSSAFTMGGGSSYTEELNHVWKGVIALNNSSTMGLRGFWTEDVDTLNTISNSVIWGQNSLGMAYTSESGVGTLAISNMTIGANGGTQLANNGQLNWKLSNSLLSVPSNKSAYTGMNSITNTSYYLASGATAGQSGGTSITQATLTAGLKYLPRVEPGSALAAAGVGANILYQEGGTGKYYGQAGWDATSTTRLWPFANEAIWSAKMKAYTASGPGGNRGFAAVNSATPLTDYIWGYLGNPKPDIYGTGGATGDTTAPTASITGPAAGSSVTGTVSVTANAADATGVSKLEFYVNGVLQATDTATPYLYSWNTSALVAGTYTLAAKAYDAAGNVGQSANVGVTVVKDVTAPVASITTPLANATVSGTTTISAGATDGMGVTRIELYANGVLKSAGNVSPLSYAWNTAGEANGSYVLTAKAYDAAGNVGQSAAVTVTVSNTTTSTGTLSIWPATATPGVVASTDTGAVELGVKFRSDVAGYITGVRFYKASTNTGTHIGNLWSSTGTLLATATFANETASGWQTVKFPTAVAIAANTVYVASYHTNTGRYSNDQGYFTGKGMDNAPLHALAEGVSGSNGVYRYGTASAFPSASWQASNYWVDPLMVLTAPVTPPVTPPTSDTTAPAVTVTSPTAGAAVSGTATVAATASDNVGVSKVEFYVNGALKSTDTAAPYSYSWGTTAGANGTYTLGAKAYDAAGNVGTSSNISVTVNNPVTVAAPIAFVQVAAATPQTPTQTVAVTYPRTQTAGNLNIVVVGWSDTTSTVQSVQDSAGNVYALAAGQISGPGVRQSIYYAGGIKSAVNRVTVTFSQAAVYPDIRILEYAGVSTPDQTAAAAGTGSTSSNGSVTTTAAKELIFSANTVTTSTAGAGTGFTSRIITSPDGDIAQDRIVGSVGTYNATAPLGSSGGWVMQMVTFK